MPTGSPADTIREALPALRGSAPNEAEAICLAALTELEQQLNVERTYGIGQFNRAEAAEADRDRLQARYVTEQEKRSRAESELWDVRAEAQTLRDALEEIAKERYGFMPDGSTPMAFARVALATPAPTGDSTTFCCVLGYPGPLPCRGCPPECPEHPARAALARPDTPPDA